MRSLQGWFFGLVVLFIVPSAQALSFSDLSKNLIPQLEPTLALSDALNDPITQLPEGLECMGGGGKPLSFMNEVVLNWKESTPDQYMNRALVRGVITNFYPDRTGHTHFGINLNSDGKGDLEVIYNDEFGELPKLNLGMTVAACGDYITVGKKARLPSPMGAIIHWVHYNPGTRDGGKHPHGFLIINSRPYGISQEMIRHRFRQ